MTEPAIVAHALDLLVGVCKASATIQYVELIRVLSFFFIFAIFILIEGFGNAAEIQTEAPAPEIGVIFFNLKYFGVSGLVFVFVGVNKTGINMCGGGWPHGRYDP